MDNNHPSLEIMAVANLPEIRPGDDIAALIAAHLPVKALEEGDILVVASKVVAKAEGQIFYKKDLTPSPAAIKAAALTGREPEYMQLVLNESERVVKQGPGVIICRTHHGFTLANAGVDASNAGEKDSYTTLPKAPDASAQGLMRQLCALTGCQRLGVVIADSFGRPWRQGQTDMAVGCAGVGAFRQNEGKTDRDGRPLKYTLPCCADELASAADLVAGKAAGVCAVLVRGFNWEDTSGAALDIPFSPEQDLFL